LFLTGPALSLDSILSLIAQKKINENLCRRIIYDELGNPELVVPMPEFSYLYGSSYEEQVQRLSLNLAKLAPELIKDAPFLAGLGLREIAPQIFRVITAIANESGQTWQATEAKRLLTDEKLLRRSLYKYGNKYPKQSGFLRTCF